MIRKFAFSIRSEAFTSRSIWSSRQIRWYGVCHPGTIGTSSETTCSFTLDTSGSARYAYWMTLALGDTQMDGTALPERQFSVQLGWRLVGGNC